MPRHPGSGKGAYETVSGLQYVVEGPARVRRRGLKGARLEVMVGAIFLLPQASSFLEDQLSSDLSFHHPQPAVIGATINMGDPLNIF